MHAEDSAIAVIFLSTRELYWVFGGPKSSWSSGDGLKFANSKCEHVASVSDGASKNALRERATHSSACVLIACCASSIKLHATTACEATAAAGNF